MKCLHLLFYAFPAAFDIKLHALHAHRKKKHSLARMKFLCICTDCRVSGEALSHHKVLHSKIRGDHPKRMVSPFLCESYAYSSVSS